MIRQMKPAIFPRLSFLGLPVRASFCGLLSGLCCSLFLLCLCSCRGDDDDAPPVPDHTAILYLRLGGDVASVPHVASAASGGLGSDAGASFSLRADGGLPLSLDAGVPAAASATTTRAPMTRAVNETAIQTVDVLSFKVDASDPMNIKKGTFFYRAQGTYTETSPGQGHVSVQLTGSAEAQTLVVLANVRSQVNALGAAYGEEKEAVMSRLKLPAKADHTPDLTNGMPMWGELPNKIVGEGFSPSSAPEEVTMIRSVVKVTLKVTNPPITHGIEEVHVYNLRTGGRVSPDNYDNAQSKVSAPTVPAGATVAAGNHINTGIPYFMTPAQESFYLFESDSKSKVTATSALAATCLVVKIKSTEIPGGGYGYYRIDFKDYTTGAYLDLLRNHDYRIEVESIEGAPAQTPDEAYKGNHTLKCKIVPWNEVNEEVKVPAVKRLSVDTRSIRLIGASAATTGKTLTVTTENTGGWTVTDVPSWLTVSPMSGTADGTGSITVKSNGSSVSPITTGSFKLKAGNAEMAIKVEQVWKLPLEYVAEFNLAGGFRYGSTFSSSSPSGASPTSAQTDADLRWATSHDNDQSGYYNWYVCKGIYNADYNPSTRNLFSDVFFTTGAGKGYHLPSRQELTGVFSYSGQIYYGGSANISVNEACEFGGIKKTFANDYFSPGNGTCYALRFKQGTGAPTGGANSSLTDFPLAADNSMCCAYRYTRVGSFASNNNLTAQLKVECVYLGEAGASMPIATISNDSWWSARASETVTRIFPAAGYISSAVVSGSGTLNGRGSHGYYWSGTEGGSSRAWHATFNSNRAGAFSWYDKDSGYAVRLFSSE